MYLFAPGRVWSPLGFWCWSRGRKTQWFPWFLFGSTPCSRAKEEEAQNTQRKGQRSTGYWTTKWCQILITSRLFPTPFMFCFFKWFKEGKYLISLLPISAKEKYSNTSIRQYLLIRNALTHFFSDPIDTNTWVSTLVDTDLTQSLEKMNHISSHLSLLDWMFYNW